MAANEAGRAPVCVELLGLQGRQLSHHESVITTINAARGVQSLGT